jgi:hypothetical protein
VDKIKLYSPTQVTIGSFMGGPFASVYMLWQNFQSLGNRHAANRSLVWGAIFIVAVLVVIPILPERFPNSALPIAYSVGARFIAEKLQMTKQAIIESDRYGFQSNWNVFGTSIGFLLAFAVIALAWVLALDALDLIKL